MTQDNTRLPPRLLAVHQTDQALYVVESPAGAFNPDACRFFVFDRSSIAGDGPTDEWLWIRTQLASISNTPAGVLLSAPDDWTFSQVISVPPVTDAEVLRVLSYQIAARVGVDSEQLTVDFQHLPRGQPEVRATTPTATPTATATAPQQVVTQSIRTQHIEQLRQQVADEHRRLLGVMPFSAAVAQLAAHCCGASSSPLPRLVVVADPSGYHVLFTMGTICVRALHLDVTVDATVDGPADIEQRAEPCHSTTVRQLVAAGRRLTAAVDQTLQNRGSQHLSIDEEQESSGLTAGKDSTRREPVEWVVLAPFPNATAVTALLTAESGLAVRVVDVSSLIGVQEADTGQSMAAGHLGPLGLLRAEGVDRRERIDLARPRPIVRERSVHERATRVAVLVAAIGMMLGVAFAWNSRQTEIHRRRLLDRIAMLDGRIRDLKPGRERRDRIRAWQQTDVDWLNELHEVAALLPGQPTTRLDRLILETRDIDFDRRGDHEAFVGSIRGDGYARSQSAVAELNLRFLEARDRYELQPHGIQQSRHDDHFPIRFELEAMLRRSAQDRSTAATDSIVGSPQRGAMPSIDAAQADRNTRQ